MPNTKKVLVMLIFSMVWVSGASRAQATNVKPKAIHQHLDHIVLINMSGKSREAHVRDTVVSLPVAQRVALQVPQGESIKITSSTNQKIVRVIRTASIGDGRTITVD